MCWGAKESDVTEQLKVTTTGRIKNFRSNSFDSKFCLANPGKLLGRDSVYSSFVPIPQCHEGYYCSFIISLESESRSVMSDSL